MAMWWDLPQVIHVSQTMSWLVLQSEIVQQILAGAHKILYVVRDSQHVY